MKQVLWISRHALSEAQREELEQVYGSFRLRWWRENVEDMEQLREVIAGSDVIAAVLPLHLMAELMGLAGERPVLVTRARRVLVDTDGAEADVCFTHGGWQRIRRLELALEPVRISEEKDNGGRGS